MNQNAIQAINKATQDAINTALNLPGIHDDDYTVDAKIPELNTTITLTVTIDFIGMAILRFETHDTGFESAQYYVDGFSNAADLQEFSQAVVEAA